MTNDQLASEIAQELIDTGWPKETQGNPQQQQDEVKEIILRRLTRINVPSVLSGADQLAIIVAERRQVRERIASHLDTLAADSYAHGMKMGTDGRYWLDRAGIQALCARQVREQKDNP